MSIKIRRVVSSQWSVVSILFFLTTNYCLLSTVCYAFEPPEYEINAFIDTKNHGLGLRFHCDLVGFLERVIFRLDVACALDEPKEDPRIWVGISHTF